MNLTQPSIEFFEGLSEDLTNVSLRRSKETGIHNVLMSFKRLKAIEKFQSFTKQSYGDLRLIDSEGIISVEPSSVKFIFGGDDGDDLLKVECTLEFPLEEHWERFMRFMQRYAEANGMGYQDSSSKSN